MQNKEKPKTTEVIKNIFFAICIILTVIAGTVIYKAKKYPNQIPDILGIKPFIVFTRSMEPVYSEGDLLFTKMINPKTIKEGDIISYRDAEDTVITHRVIQIVERNGEQFYKTKGDAALKEDEGLVNINQIEGAYVSKIPKVGKILYAYQKPVIFLLTLLTILAVGLIWVYAADKVDMMKEMKEENDRQQEEMKRNRKKVRRVINRPTPRHPLGEIGSY